MLNKKEHCYDVVTKLEKSIKEAQKIYQRKIKEIKTTLNENSEKLNIRNKENEALKSEIEDLNKILSLTEQENKINNIGQTMKSKKNNKNMNKTNNNIKNNEKELESQKEYLSPEIYSNNNKNDKDKMLMPTHSNPDMTRNEMKY